MPGTVVNHNEPRDVDPFSDEIIEPSLFFGQVDFYSYTSYASKGDNGKWTFVPYDPPTHGSEAEITARNKARGQNEEFTSRQVELTFTPVDPTRKIFTNKFGIKNKNRPGFMKIVYPSVRALEEKIAKIKGFTVGQFRLGDALNGMWIQGEYVPEPGNEEWSIIKFVDVYAGEAECRAAAGVDDTQGEIPGFEPTPAVQPVQAEDPQRAALAKFLPALWAQAGEDQDEFLKAIAENPLLAPFFNETSTEVLQILAPF